MLLHEKNKRLLGLCFWDSLRSSGVYHPESFKGRKNAAGNEGSFRMKFRCYKPKG